MSIENLWKELKKFGINNEKELDEAIAKMKPLNIGGFVNKVQKNNEEGEFSEDVVYTVKEVSLLIKTNVGYVYNLIRKGYLPALNLGSLKVRKSSLLEFLEKYDGKDLSDLDNVKDLNTNREDVIDEEV